MNSSTKQGPSTEARHPFEVAGLGKAPFRYLGIETQDLRYGSRILNREEYVRTGIAIETKPGGSCALCGTYIVEMHRFRDAGGKAFHVGSDCVEKHLADRAGSRKLVAAVRQAGRDRATAIRRVREDDKIAAGTTMLAREDVRAALAAQPSAVAWRATNGDTRLDEIEFRLQHSGRAGKLRIAAELAAIAGAMNLDATASMAGKRP